MNRTVTWFARNSVAANLLMLGIFLSGFVSLYFMKIEVFPETSMDTVTITVAYPGAAPEEVEEGICVRVEEKIFDLAGIKRISSQAMEGMGSIRVEVETGHNVRQLLDDIKTRVDSIDTFPEEAEKPVIEESIMKSQVLGVAISGDTSEENLKVIAERIRDDINNLPGITQVTLANTRPYEISIEVSEASLRRWNLTFSEVADAIRKSSVDIPAGSVKSKSGEITLRTKGQAYRQTDFSRMILRTEPNGARVTLGDVATVKDGFEDTPLTSRFNGKPAALVNVFRVGDQNALTISKTVRKYVDEKASAMPEGISLTVWKDDSLILKDRITLLLRNAINGLLLVFLSLALFLRFRLAFWVTFGIPTAFLGAFIVMGWMDVSINMISLFGLILVLGIVVDDAIVVGENIYTHIQNGVPGQKAVVVGTRQVAIPVVFAVLTTVAAFFPLLGIPGFMGKIWRVIPLTVIPCLLVSLVESQLILPSHLRHLQTRDTESPWIIPRYWYRFQSLFTRGLDSFVQKQYKPTVAFCTAHPYFTVTGFFSLFAAVLALVVTGWIKFVYFPDVPADIIIARLEMPQGTTFETTQQAVQRIEKAAIDLQQEFNQGMKPGEGNIRRILATAGLQPLIRQVTWRGQLSPQTNIGEIVMELAPGDERTVEVKSVERKWRERVGSIPGAVELAFASSMGNFGDPINIQLVGHDFTKLKAVADELKSRIASYPGTQDITDTFREGKDEMKFQLKPNADALGITLSELGRQIRQGFYGEEVQRVQRGRDDVRVMVRYPLSERQSMASLETARIRTRDGSEVPLPSVAEVTLGKGFSSIDRINRKRAVNVRAGVDIQKGNPQEIRKSLDEHGIPEILKKYPSVNYTWEGEGKEQADTLGALGAGFLLALAAIYALMAIPFKSYTQPLIIMSVIPFGLVGSIMGHVVMGLSVSMLSICGIVALAGVVVNDGIVLIDTINRLLSEGHPLLHAVREAGVMRFRAILLTSLTTFIGLVPLMLERSMQAQFLIPMANALAFGVLFATVLNLIMVPALCIVLNDIKKLLGMADAHKD